MQDQRNFLNSFAHTVAQVAVYFGRLPYSCSSSPCSSSACKRQGTVISHFYQKRYPDIEYRRADRLDPDEKTDL